MFSISAQSIATTLVHYSNNPCAAETVYIRAHELIPDMFKLSMSYNVSALTEYISVRLSRGIPPFIMYTGLTQQAQDAEPMSI